MVTKKTNKPKKDQSTKTNKQKSTTNTQLLKEQPVDTEKQLSIAEIVDLAEPLPPLPSTSSTTETRGRKASGRFVTYDEASSFVQEQLIASRIQYDEWWIRHKPKDIPRYPHRSYPKVWKGWNAFLGTNNTFGAQNVVKYRSYEEAMRFAHSLNLPTFNKWLDYVRSDNLPEDIPRRPDLVYPKWRTWPHFLGVTVTEQVEAKQQLENTQLYFIIREPGYPENVLTFGSDSFGLSAFKDRWEKERFDIVRIFWFSSKDTDYIKQVVTQLSRPYIGDEYRRIVPNFWEVIYYLEQRLDRANLKNARLTKREMNTKNESATFASTTIDAEDTDSPWSSDIKPLPI